MGTGGELFSRTHLHKEQRYQREGAEHRSQQREHNGIAHIPEELSGHAVHHGDGQEYHHGGGSGGHNGREYQIGAHMDGIHIVQAVLGGLEAAVDDDDGAVRHHTDAHHQAAQGHEVDAHVKGRHEDQGCQHRNGHGDADDEGALPLAEEEHQYQGGNDQTFDERGDNAHDVVIDVLTAVADDLESQAQAAVGIELIDQLFDLIADGYGIAVLLLGDRNADILLAVLTAVRGALLFHHLHIRHIREVDHRSGRQRDGNILQVPPGVILRAADEGQGDAAPVEFTQSGFIFRRGDGAGDLLHAQTVLGHGVLIEQHPDILPGTAADLHICHSLDPFDLRHDIVLHIGHSVVGIGGGDGDIEDRTVHAAGIHLHDGGIGTVFRKLHHSQGGSDVLVLVIGVHIVAKFQHDHGRSLTGGGGHRLHFGDARKSRFDLLGDHLVHLIRRGIGIAGHNGHGGHIHLRRGLQRHLKDRGNTEQNQADQTDKDADRPLD